MPKVEITQVHYRAAISIEDFTKITDRDSEYENEVKYDLTLVMLLDKIEGVDDVDYNGHFGSNIFFSIAGHPKTHKKTKAQIMGIISAYVKGE